MSDTEDFITNQDSGYEQIYTIKEVAEKLDVSTPTIRNWEREMDGILTIHRDSNQNRYYVQEDIDNFRKISELKEQGLQFNAIRKIFSTFKNSVSSRPQNAFMNVPEVYEKQKEQITEQIQEENKKLVENLIYYIEDKFKSLENSISKQLQLPGQDRMQEEMKEVNQKLSEFSDIKQWIHNLRNPEQERRERLEQMITTKRVERILRDEALKEWGSKPEAERMRKVSWLKTEEDLQKRDSFVRSYIDDRFEEYMLKEFNETTR